MHTVGGPEIGIRVGDLIADKYRVDRVLGVGGMGVVVAARHLRLEELVAIKLLLPEALADADAVRRFEQEARAAVKIKSEHVARILDVGSLDDGAPYIVMEHLAGEDLADRIARIGVLPVEDAVELLLQACEAVAEAHTLGIVHRDLKPANLFCVQGADGRPAIKVLDFGISKFTKIGTSHSGLGLTKTTTMMGSPYYMSPEQMESPRNVDPRTDIWSLGVVLFQLLTGDVPFGGETLPQVCVNVATRPAPPLRKARPDASNGLEAIVQRCLEKDPSKRYPSIAALATALARFGPRRAQASLDRIVRASRPSEPAPSLDTEAHLHRATDRPVTGSLPSWGATAKSFDRHTKSAVSWGIAILAVTALTSTLWRRESPRSAPPSPAVLVAPTKVAEPNELVPDEIARTGKKEREGELARAPAPTGAVGSATPVRADNPTTAPLAAAPPPSPAREATPIGQLGETARARPTAPSADEPERNPYERPRPLAAAPQPSERERNPYEPSLEAPKDSETPTCILNLNATPAARVVVDGTPLGSTPKAGVTVPVGRHRILFKWDDGEKRQVVTCTRGESKTIGMRRYEAAPAEDVPPPNPYR